MKRTHVLRIETQGNKGRLMVNIFSDYYGQKISIPIENEPGDLTPAINNAKKHLESIGYKFDACCVGKHVHYLVSDNFIPLTVPFANIEIIKKEEVNYQKRILVELSFEPVMVLMQIDGNCNLWHTDKTGNPTKPSDYWLPEPLDFE